MSLSTHPGHLLPVAGLSLAAILLWPAPTLAGKPDPGSSKPSGGSASGYFACRASAARANKLLGSVFEPIVANAAEVPCATDNHVLLSAGPLGGLDLSAQVLVANTEDTNAPVTSESFATGVDVLGLVSVQALEARATAKSVNGVCVLAGESTVTSAVVAGIPINLVSGHTEIPLAGVGTVHFNETLRPSGNRLVQRALWVEITNPLMRSLLGVKDVVVAEAVVDFANGNPCGGKPSRTDKRRMTGGGSFAHAGGSARHGFVLHCNAARAPNNLQVNWGGNRFHLEALQSASCSDGAGIDPGQPAANFDTHAGRGTGRLNGVAGATAEWTLTDAGEPGANDTVRLVIRNASGQVVFSTGGSQLNQGNHQAHSD